MTDSKIISWIFLAVAIASSNEHADTKSISKIADGINHAVPTQNELRMAISWLLRAGQIKMQGKKYTLTKNGLINYQFASLNTNVVLNIWRNLERQLKIAG